jgi:hypothetical protein
MQEHFCTNHLGPALDLLEFGWHDGYGDISPSEEVVHDVLLISDGTLAGLIRSVRLELADWRDVKLTAASMRDAK